MFKTAKRNIRNDVLAGLTAVLTLIPEAVAFTFVAGIDPMMGLYGSFFIGFITAVFGGRPGMISGAAGSMAVVTTAFIIMFGLEYLLAAVVLTGVLQLLFGAFKFGKFIRLMPHPVMLGFVNGLAIVIGLAQFNQFKENTRVVYDSAADLFTYAGDWMVITSPGMITMMSLIGLTMLIVHLLPRYTKAVPAPLVAIVVCGLLVNFAGLETKRVSDVVLEQRLMMTEKNIIESRFDAIKNDVPYGEYTSKATQIAKERPTDVEIQQQWLAEQKALVDAGEKSHIDVLDGSLKGTLPSFHLPDIDWELSNPNARDALLTVFLLALVLSSVGLIETLMTQSLVDEITDTKGDGNRESLAQGAGNVVSGFFGGMCGCAMIGQTMVNLNSGGRGRLSGIVTALFMLVFILFFPALIEMIPVASLIGVMFMVVIATFEWSSLRLFGKVPKSELVIIITVSALTVILDLAVAVGIGIVIAALVYAWNSAKQIKVESRSYGETCEYFVGGNVFFGSISDFKTSFSTPSDAKHVVIDFSEARICDQSAIEAITVLSDAFSSRGQVVELRYLSDDCVHLLSKAGVIVKSALQDEKGPSEHFFTTNSSA